MEEKNCRKVNKETTISIGIVLTIIALIGSGIFIAGRITGDIHNNSKKIDNNKQNIQSIKEDIQGLPTRQEFKNLQNQVEYTNKNISEIKNFLMK